MSEISGIFPVMTKGMCESLRKVVLPLEKERALEVRGRLLLIPGTFGPYNRSCSLFIDSGAEVSLVKESWVEGENRENELIILSGLGKRTVTTLSKTTDTINIRKIPLKTTLYIVKDKDLPGPGDILLGLDFLEQNNITISFNKREIYLKTPDKRSFTIHTISTKTRDIVNVPLKTSTTGTVPEIYLKTTPSSLKNQKFFPLLEKTLTFPFTLLELLNHPE